MFKKYCKNSKVTFITDPIRIVPIIIIGYFMIPYFFEFGITATQLGQAQSVSGVIGVICSLIAAIVVNNIGRKLSTIIFWDIVYIVALFFIYLTKSWQYAIFPVFMCMAGISRIGSTGYVLLRQEDEKPEYRGFIMGYTTAVPMGAKLLCPVVGLLLGYMALIDLMKYMLIICAVIEVINTIFRLIYFKETEVGKSMKTKETKFSVLASIKSYLKIIPEIFTSKKYLTLGLIYAAVTFGSYFDLAFPTFLLGKKIVNDAGYAYIGFGFAAGALFAQFVLMPLFNKLKINDLKVMIYSTLLSGLAMAGFVVLGENSIFGAFVLYTIYGAAFLFAFSYVAVLVVNHSEESKNADLLGTYNFICQVIASVFPLVLGAVLDFNLNYGMLMCSTVWIAISVICVVFDRIVKKESIVNEL